MFTIRTFPYILVFLSLCLFAKMRLSAQCQEPSAWTQSFTSCVPSPNPNPARGEGHWLIYDFGRPYLLTELYLWNANEIARLDQGVKDLTIDYSPDGQNWTDLGSFPVEKASGRSYYGGTQVAQFESIKAQYVLLSLNANWGDSSCTTVTEVMFTLKPANLPVGQSFLVFPNPAQDRVNVVVETDQSMQLTLRMVNMMGRTVDSQSFFSQSGEQAYRIQTGHLSPGLYVVQLVEENGRVIGHSKVVIRR